MATRFSNTLHINNSTDADFRAWVQFIEDTLVTTGGWVVTGDTGQMTISTASHPTAVNQKVGFRLYRMADTLQATAPVYMRLDYGSCAASAGEPAFWITIGTGSDGAGNITGLLFNGGASATATLQTNITGTNACDSYGSASTSRVHLLMFVRSGGNDLLVFSLERSKDTNGNDTADGLIMVYNSTSNGVDRCQYLLCTPGSQPPIEAGISMILSNQSASSFSSNVGVGIAIPFKGIAQQPGTGFVAVDSGDFIAEATISFSLYGATRTYQLGNTATNQLSIPGGNTTTIIRSNTRVGIRYD